MLALAAGAFCIGMTEFLPMGLLPDIARGLDVSIPAAGNLVTVYAMGVVIGGPLAVAFTIRWPRKLTLLVLMGVLRWAMPCALWRQITNCWRRLAFSAP